MLFGGKIVNISDMILVIYIRHIMKHHSNYHFITLYIYNNSRFKEIFMIKKILY